MSRCVAALKYGHLNHAMHGWMRLNHSPKIQHKNIYECIFTTYGSKSYNKFDNSDRHSNVDE